MSAFQVMQNIYENRKTGEKALGCTIMIHGEFQDLLDDLMKKHPEYKDYSEIMGAAVQLGVNELGKG